MRSPWLILAVFCLCAPVRGSGEEFDRCVAELGSPESAVRARARAALEAGGAEALPCLIGGLDSANPAAAATCAEIIGAGGHRGGRRRLSELLKADGTPDLVRRACCRALSRVGDYRDVEPLTALAARFAEAAEALASLGEAAALPGLRRLAGEDGAPPSVLFAVARLGGDDGVRGLIGSLSGDNDAEVLHYLRRIAGRDAGSTAQAWADWWRREVLARELVGADWVESEAALKRTLESASPGGTLSEEVFRDLVAISRDAGRAREARCKAILALGLAAERRALGDILDLLNGDADGMVRVYAAEALGRVGDPATAVDLSAYLIFDEEPFRKRSAKDATVTVYFTIDSEVSKSLVKLGVKGGLDYMIRQLGENHRVRVFHQAVRTLRRATGQNHDFRPDGNRGDRAAAARRWRTWFDEHRGEIRLAGPATVARGRLATRIESLVETLDHFHFLKMSRARETLVLLGECALPALLAGLESPQTHVRVHCAEILARIHAKDARGALAKAAGDERSEVRSAAVTALGVIGPGGKGGVLVDAVRDPDLDVRIAAVGALSRATWWEAVPCVSLALLRSANRSDTFRREAYFTLASHGDPGAVDALSGLLDHPDQAFRQLVADRLESLTGKNPGMGRASIEEWRRWWKVSRTSDSPFGADRTVR